MFPKNYEPKVEESKSDSRFVKLTPGTHKLRVVTDAVVGYEFWSVDNKPIRTKKYPTNFTKAKRNDDGDITVREFWAVGVVDMADNLVKTWQITQKTIKKAILTLYEDEDYGDPKGYDLKITRTGKDLSDTEYNVVPGPIRPFTPTSGQKKDIDSLNLEALFEGKYPSETPKAQEEKEEIDLDDIPF